MKCFLKERYWVTVFFLVIVMGLFHFDSPVFGQTLQNNLGGSISLHGTNNTGIGQVSQIAFAPGDTAHAFVSTFGNGIWRFDYDPNAVNFMSNGVQVVPNSIASSGGVPGSLGLAFHQDPVLGTVMYIAPAVPFSGGNGFDDLVTQSIVRLTDTGGNGIWGDEAGDVNQAIANNIRVTQLHQINQLQVRGNMLYAAIGSSTQNGGIVGGNGDQTDPGETEYTGTVAFIEDLRLLNGDTATANTAGFTTPDITGNIIVNDNDVRSDTQSMTSTSDSKLRVFSTGFRNNYGIGLDGTGELWVSMNQNESPQLPDELHRAYFQSDHGFAKANDVVGDWRVDGDEAGFLGGVDPSAAAIAAGYFDANNLESPFVTMGNNTALGGLDFFSLLTEDESLRDDVLVSRFSTGDVWFVDRVSGQQIQILSGLNGALDVQRDPFGNILAGGANGVISLLAVPTIPIPEPASLILVLFGVGFGIRRQR